MGENQDFDNLEPEEAQTQLVTWAWDTTGPDVETVKRVAEIARPYIWQECPEEPSLLVLGELCRYALCKEPYRENWETWRDALQEDGLAEAYFQPESKLGGGAGCLFAFDFAKCDPDRLPSKLRDAWDKWVGDFCPQMRTDYALLHLPAEERSKLLDICEPWMTASRVDMRRAFLFGMQEFGEDYCDEEDRPVPPMPDRRGPPECVTDLQRAIETFYVGIVDVVHGRDVDEDLLDNAADNIGPAADELQVILAMVHEPIYAGMFCQAIHDAFDFRLWDYVEDEESLRHWLGEWTNDCMLGHYADLWSCKDIGQGIPYFRKAVSLMAEFWPYADPYDDLYYPAKTAAALTGLKLVELNRLSEPGGPVRCKRPSKNRRLIHLGDLADYMMEQNPHI